MYKNPLTCIDFYKADHRRQYPSGVSEVYSNLTARSDKLSPIDYTLGGKRGVIFFGLQYFIKDFLINTWQANFFDKPLDEVLSVYKKRMDRSLGIDVIPLDHIEKLHTLGYLPLLIKARAEGALCKIGTPLLTVVNTHPDFYWLTNYIETVLSTYLWKPITSATIAYNFRCLLETYWVNTVGNNVTGVNFQGHDFSFRGMSCVEDAAISGAAHLLSFSGTDSVVSLDLLDEFYGDSEGYSVPATEHSVMCMGGKDDEFNTFKRLICDLYPKGIVSIVSDTWDYWKVLTEFLPQLKDTISNRTGKVVIRPDSGDPVKIICGDEEAPLGSPEYKGSVQVLAEVFGYTINDLGYKELPPEIGLIYGDSITFERAHAILEGLSGMGFATNCIVFGVGSFTYEYLTRDSFGFAVKATSGVINDKRVSIFKAPKTDSGTKKSAKGLVMIDEHGDLVQDVSETDEKLGLLKPVYKDGVLLTDLDFYEVRYNVQEN